MNYLTDLPLIQSWKEEEFWLANSQIKTTTLKYLKEIIPKTANHCKSGIKEIYTKTTNISSINAEFNSKSKSNQYGTPDSQNQNHHQINKLLYHAVT